MAVVWDWVDFWAFFEAIDDPRRKTETLKQIDANFVRGLSYEAQVTIFMSAPLEIVTNIQHILKAGVVEFIVAERNKQLRKIKRRK